MLRHFGALGLFFLAILDSSPLPTFGGPDILIAILVATRPYPWYEYAIVATAGSAIGAYLTFRLARKAGETYLESKFGKVRVIKAMGLFEKYGSGALIATTAVPFPFPTSVVFAAAGASHYPLGKYLGVVSVSRGVRYSAIGIVAHVYGRHFVRILRHPTQYWGWLLVFTGAMAVVIVAGVLVNKWVMREEAG